MRKKGTPYHRRNRAPARTPDHFIRAWREYRHWSQEVLAEKTGLSVSAISAYERGDDNPSLDALQKLASAFEVPRGMLLDVDPRIDPPLWASVLRATGGPIEPAPKSKK